MTIFFTPLRHYALAGTLSLMLFTGSIGTFGCEQEERLVFFSIINQTGAEIHVRVLADGRKLFSRRVAPMLVDAPGTMPPPGRFPRVEVKAPLSTATRELVVEELLVLRSHRTIAIAGFARTDAGFAIVINRSGISVSQDYYPVR
jgi:hypothetical protein